MFTLNHADLPLPVAKDDSLGDLIVRLLKLPALTSGDLARIANECEAEELARCRTRSATRVEPIVGTFTFYEYYEKALGQLLQKHGLPADMVSPLTDWQPTVIVEGPATS